MSKDRDLFRAIVISGVALVGNAGCDHDAVAADGGAPDAAVPKDAGVDAAKPADLLYNLDAFPAIL